MATFDWNLKVFNRGSQVVGCGNLNQLSVKGRNPNQRLSKRRGKNVFLSVQFVGEVSKVNDSIEVGLILEQSL